MKASQIFLGPENENVDVRHFGIFHFQGGPLSIHLAFWNFERHDSESEFASSIKLIVDRKINEGLKEKQIYQFLREKYGDWVIFDPQLNKNTYVLWLLPLLLFLFGGAIIYKKIISNKNNKI